MNDENIDKLFKAQLAEKEVAPPKVAWDKLDKALNKEKKTIWYHQYAAAAAVLLLVSIMGYYKLSSPTKEVLDHEPLAVSEPLEKQAAQVIETPSVVELAEKVIVPVQEEKQPAPKKQMLATSKPAPVIKSIADPKPDIDVTVEPGERPFKNVIKSNEVIVSLLPAAENEGVKSQPEESINNTTDPKKGPTVTIVYLRKNPDSPNIAQTSSSEEPTSTTTMASLQENPEAESKLKKFFRAAKEIKEGELSITDVRNLKEDILNMKIKL